MLSVAPYVHEHNERLGRIEQIKFEISQLELKICILSYRKIYDELPDLKFRVASLKAELFSLENFNLMNSINHGVSHSPHR